MAIADDIRATIDRYVETFSADDREGWLDQFAADGTLEDPVGTDVRTGRDAIGEFWDFVHTLSPSIRMEAVGPVKIVATGATGEAAFAFRVVSDLGGQLMAAPIIDVMTFDEAAKITSMRAFWDMADLAPYEG